MHLYQVEIAEKICHHGVHALSEYAYDRGRFYQEGEEKSLVQVAVGAKLHSQSVVPFTRANDALGTEEFDCLEALSSDGFTAIIVPGYGIVLVESNDLVSSRQRPARSDCCSLDFFSASHKRGQSSSVRGLHLLLELCGASLRSLDILHHEALESLEVLSILQWCPLLEEVAVNHDGKLWSSPLACQSTNLKAIRLSCSLIEAFCVVSALCEERKAAFPNVQALYFHVTKGALVFHSMSKRLGGLLLANPTIEDFAMVKLRRSASPTSRITLDRLAKRLAAMRISPQDIVSADLPSNIRRRNELIAALKLVWSRKSLPIEIFETAIRFVAAENPRNVWIDLL